MATPLELLKARRAATQKQVQGMLTPQGGAGDRIGRGLVTAARALSGGFDDPDEQALATYQEQNKDFDAAQQAQGGGAFTAPFKPDYDPRSDLSGFTPEMRESIQSDNTRRNTPFTQEGMMNQAKQMYQNGNIEGANQAMAYAKALAPAKEKTPQGELFQITDSSGNVRGRMFVKQGEEPNLPEGMSLQKIGSGRQAPLVNIEGDKPLSAEDQLKLAGDTKFAEELAKSRAKGIASKEEEDILVGASAAEQIPSLNRSIELLKSVETGGVDGLTLRAKQVLGIEVADEAELTNALEKGVISQLREVFGAQFTAKEGQWLKDIEANIGKSTAGNIRLLERGLELSTLRVENGVEASIAAGDVRARRQMEKMMSFKIEPKVATEEPVEAPKFKEGDSVTNGKGETIKFINGAWVKQ